MANNFVLQECLPFLLNRAGVGIGLAFSRDIVPYNITLPMWRVLVALWENGDQRLNELSVLTSVDPSTLSRVLVNMQRRRLIVRRRSGNDARALSLRLTANGRHIATKIIPLAIQYERVAVSGLSEADVKRLKRLLTKVYTNIETSNLGHAEHQDESTPREYAVLTVFDRGIKF
jgi:Transcriptional regulators